MARGTSRPERLARHTPKATRSIPTEADVASAQQVKVEAERVLQQTLIWRNKEGQAVDGACWVRRRQAEGLIK